MVKHKYWVSVGDQEIVPEGDTVNAELEIEATDQEITELRERLDELVRADSQLLARASTPYEHMDMPDQEIKNISYDDQLRNVYRLIHQLGVPETKAHIEEMDIII
jgi:hypothetical protein